MGENRGKMILLVVAALVLLLGFRYLGGMIINSVGDVGISDDNGVEYEKENSNAPIGNEKNVQDKQNKEEEEEEEEEYIAPENREEAVYIRSFREGYGSRPDYLILKANLENNEKVNITGWKVVGNSGEFTIPQAVNNYSVVASSNVEEDIILKDREYIEIYFGEESPIGKNLRLNKCIGYLNRKADFNPELPDDCEVPSKEEYKHLSGQCQDYIRSLNECEYPDFSVVNSFRGEEGNECRDFINRNINPGYCYRTHSGDEDFLDNEWRVWIDREVFDSEHDWIRLFNRNGKLIDEDTY